MQVRRVRCEASGVMVPKDKAIKRFIVRNIVDASAIRDIQDSSVFDGEQQLQLFGLVAAAGQLLQHIALQQQVIVGSHSSRWRAHQSTT